MLQEAGHVETAVDIDDKDCLTVGRGDDGCDERVEQWEVSAGEGEEGRLGGAVVSIDEVI